MKIYFTASARSKFQHKKNVVTIFDTIKKLGHTHLDDFLITVDEHKLYSGSTYKIDEIYKKAKQYIHAADAVVLEVSEPSISMGFVLQSALDEHKQIILLHTEKKYPIVLSGITSENLQVIEYSLTELTPLLSSALSCISKFRFLRFNFFLSPDHIQHLIKMSRKFHKPKSAYLRELIQIDLEKNTL